MPPLSGLNSEEGRTAAGRTRFALAQRLRESVFGLQCKSTVLVVTLTLCVAVLVGWVFFRLSGRLTAHQHRAHALHVCSLMAQLAAEPIASGDRDALQELADHYATGEPLLYVAFSDDRGKLIAASGRDRTLLKSVKLADRSEHRATVGHPVFRPASPGLPTHLDVSYPITELRPFGDVRLSSRSGEATGTPLLGYARVGFNVDPMLKEFAGVMDMVSGIGLICVILTVPMAFLVVRHIVVPLNELSRTADRLAGGDLSARSTVDRSDEIGQLACAFNRMADEISRHQTEITSINAELEERVRQRTEQLREMASRDPLTGLYNRRHFDEVLVRSLAEAERYGNILTCLMIDLDNFKAVNDRFGHQVGDQVLIVAARTVQSELRAADVAARFGGDEFVVLLPHTGPDQAEILARRIAERFSDGCRARLPDVPVGVSVGIASLDGGMNGVPETLVRAADRALYVAKQGGKNRVAVAPVPA